MGCGGKGLSDDPDVVPPPALVSPSSGEATDTTIKRGELINVYVLNDDSFSGRYAVHDGGEIVLRRVGRVQVAGKSTSAAEAAIRRALAGHLSDAKVVVARSASATASPRLSNTMEVYVSGKVNKPGKLVLPVEGASRPTVYRAVVEAGGFMRYAHKGKVHVLRKGADGKLYKIPADIVAIERGEIPDVALVAGDTVVVPERTFGMGP